MEFRDPFAQPSQSFATTEAITYDAGLRAYMLKIYNYMASGLGLTGIVSLFIATSPQAMGLFYTIGENGQSGMTGLGWIALFAPLGLVLWLGMGLQRMQTSTAQAIFWSFAILMGISTAPIFLVYTGSSIARTFFVTAGTFGAMSLYGYTTKKDLTGLGSFLMMGLFGIIIASIANMFFNSPGLTFAVSVIGVLIFVGLTAYDTQRLKNMYYQLAGGGEMVAKASIMGALTLYLDFINMFMYLLRFMGDRR